MERFCVRIFKPNFPCTMTRSIYARLSRIKFKRDSYSFKFLLVSIVGIHIPLIGFVSFLLIGGSKIDSSTTTLILLVLTLTATLVTGSLLKKLTSPIEMSVDAIQKYNRFHTLPTLPVGYSDEAGTLMAKLQTTITQLHNHIEEKQDLATLLAQDLRQPFSQMMGILEIIKLENNPKKVDLYCNRMIAEGKRRLEFLEYVLEELQNPEFESDENERTYITLPELISGVAENLHSAATKKRIIFFISSKCNPVIEGNEEELNKALSAVFKMALKYSFPGGKITIESDNYANAAQITIRDFGIGFDEKMHRNLFKRFIQSPPGTQGENTAEFGLFKARKYIENHRGTLTAESEGYGKGSTYRIKLPIV